MAYIGYLEQVPVSVFVGEKLTDTRIGCYTSFTLRESEEILPQLGMVPGIEKAKGFTAIPVYALIRLFREWQKKGVQEVHLGGSELPELNWFKRRLGARNDPSYWAVRLKEQ